MIIVDEKRNPERFTAALWLVVQRYAAQVRRRPGVCVPALLLPGIGDVLVFYTPPLVIANLLRAFAREPARSTRRWPLGQ